MKTLESTLRKFGLSENEVKVYLACIEEDELGPYQISKLTDIPRTTVYDVLLNLSLKGLVELDQSDGMKKQQTKVTAKNPSILRKILEERRKELTMIEFDLIDYLPDLKNRYHSDKSNSSFRFYPGIKGARKVLLEEDVDSVDLPSAIFTKLLPMDIFGKVGMNSKIKKKVELRKGGKSNLRMLVPENSWTQHVLTYQYATNSGYFDAFKVRTVLDPAFDVYLRLVIKGDQVRAICEEEEEIWGIVIKSKALSKTLLSLFEMLWREGETVDKKRLERWGENEMVRLESQQRTSKKPKDKV